MEVRYTKHGMQRLKQRINLPRDVLETYTQRAWDEGIKPVNLKGYAKQQLEAVAIEHSRRPLQVRIFNEYIFLFGGGALLITVLNVKDVLKNYKNYIKK